MRHDAAMTMPRNAAPGRSGWGQACRGMLEDVTIRKGFLAITGQGFASATNFLTGVIIGRACTKEQLGLYTLGFALVVFLLEVQTALIATPYMVYSPRLEGAEHQRYTGSSLVQQVAFFMVVVGLLAGAAAGLSLGFGPGHLAPVLWILTAVVTFIMLKDYVRRLCFATMRMGNAVLVDAGVAVLQIGALLVLARLGVLTPGRAFWVIGAACGAVALAWLFSHRRLFCVRMSSASGHLRQNWTFAKWVFFSAVLWSLSMNFYPFILEYLKGTASVGVWGACFAMVALGNPLLMGGQNFLGPKIAAVYAADGAAVLRTFVLKASLAYLAPLLLFCTVLWFIGGGLVVWLYGAKYAGNGWIVFTLSLNLPALALTFTFSRALFVIERADVDFAVNFVALFVLLTFGIWMVRAYGPLGAAWGLCVANTAAFATRCAAFLYMVRARSEVQKV